jgi:hypothetical protein
VNLAEAARSVTSVLKMMSPSLDARLADLICPHLAGFGVSTEEVNAASGERLPGTIMFCSVSLACFSDQEIESHWIDAQRCLLRLGL